MPLRLALPVPVLVPVLVLLASPVLPLLVSPALLVSPSLLVLPLSLLTMLPPLRSWLQQLCPGHRARCGPWENHPKIAGWPSAAHDLAQVPLGQVPHPSLARINYLRQAIWKLPRARTRTRPRWTLDQP